MCCVCSPIVVELLLVHQWMGFTLRLAVRSGYAYNV